MENRYPIALDVDGTLLDSKRLVDSLKEELVLRTGKKENEIEDLFNRYKETLGGDSTRFNHIDFIKFAIKSGYVSEQVESVYDNADLFEQCVYDEIQSFLQEIQSFCSVLIFSQAIKEWQEHKLELSGIAALVDDWNTWVIEENKLSPEAIALLPENAILFDDKLEVLEAVSAARSDVKCVWVNRMGASDRVPFEQIRDFSEVSKTFLKKLHYK